MKRYQTRVWTVKGASWAEGPEGYYTHPIETELHNDNLPLSGSYSELKHLPCLVLLGTPGSGKTSELKIAKTIDETPEALTVDIRLSQVNSFDYLQTLLAETSRLISSEIRKVVFFFDALDESPISPIIAEQWLVSISKQGKKLFERLGVEFSIRVSCRTADWLEQFEDDLSSIWEKPKVGIYELPPLSLFEVREIASQNSINPDAFISEIENVGGKPLAGRPVTLNLLINTYKKNRSITQNKVVLYRQGLLALCDESNDIRRYTKNTGKLNAESRFEYASRLAALTNLTNKTFIFDGSLAEILPEGSIYLSQALTNSEKSDVTGHLENMKEVLTTGLYTTHSKNLYSWAHQTFNEFLAAHYLVTNSQSLETLKEFLLAKIEGNSLVIPQLRETAGWVSLMSSQFFDYLASTEPELLLNSDAALSSDDEKFRLTEELLRYLDEERYFDNYEWRTKYKNLNHPRIAEQLDPYITEKSRSVFARRASFFIASGCGQTNLEPKLRHVALDQTEVTVIRVNALRAIILMAPKSNFKELKGLVNIPKEQDPDDEIKGLVLESLWPKDIEPKELFAVLAPPQNKSLIGHYNYFLYQLDFNTLEESGAIEGIHWLYDIEKIYEDFHFEKVVNNLLISIWRFRDSENVMQELSKLILHLHKKSPFFHIRSDFTEVYASTDCLYRQKLLRCLLENAPSEWNKVAELTYIPWQIISSNDFDWLLQEYLRAKDSSIKEIYLDTIFRILTPDNQEAWKQLLNASDSHASLEQRIAKETYIELASSYATWQSEKYLHRKAKHEVREGEPNLTPYELIENAIQRTQADISYWWQLNLILIRDRDNFNTIDEFKENLDQGIWNDLSDEKKTEIINFAYRYISTFEISEIDHIKPNSYSRPALAGYRAFNLLLKHAVHLYDGIPVSIWSKWFEALINFPATNHLNKPSNQPEILADAYLKNPDQFQIALSSVATSKLDLFNIFVSCDEWADDSLIDHFWKIFQSLIDQLSSPIAVVELFFKRSYSPAINYALSKLNDLLSDDPNLEDQDFEIIAFLINTNPELVLKALDKLYPVNYDYFAKLIVAATSRINLGVFIQTSSEHPFLLANLYYFGTLFKQYSLINDLESPRDDLSFFLSRATNQLVENGTPEAIEAIAWLIHKQPEHTWLKWALNDARENQRKSSILWPSPESILEKLNIELNINYSRSNVESARPIIDDVNETILIEDTVTTISDTSLEDFKVMLVAKEWLSRNGGVSTLNRKLGKELATKGFKVYCFIPKATAEEIELAKKDGVTILTSDETPGIDTVEQLLCTAPQNPPDFKPDLIIGHSHITGPHALRLAKKVYNCSYAHVVHTLPGELEAHKPSDQDPSVLGRPSAGTNKATLQKKICLASDLVITIGPVLYDSVADSLRSHGGKSRIFQLDPGLDESYFHINLRPAEDLPKNHKCRMSGRLEDTFIKGLDIVGLLAKKCSDEKTLSHLRFLLRGFDSATLDQKYTEFMRDNAPKLSNIIAKPYTSDDTELMEEMFELSLVLMPSRCEAFGLVGLEAISAGIPVIISKTSGLGNLLLQYSENPALSLDTRNYLKEVVIETYQETLRNIDPWFAQLQKMMNDRDNAFRRAHNLREELKSHLCWSNSIDKLTREIENIS